MKTTLLSLVLAGTVLTGGALTSITWTGNEQLTAAEATAEMFKTTADQYVIKAKELEALAKSQNVDITTLTTKITELRGIRTTLEGQIDELQTIINNSNENTTLLEDEITRLTTELENANSEIDEANTAVVAHKAQLDAILNPEIFVDFEEIEKVDITRFTEPEPPVEELEPPVE